MTATEQIIIGNFATTSNFLLRDDLNSNYQVNYDTNRFMMIGELGVNGKRRLFERGPFFFTDFKDKKEVVRKLELFKQQCINSVS